MKTLDYSVSFILENSLIVLNSLLNDQSALDLLAEYKQTRETLENGVNMHTIAQELESRQIANREAPEWKKAISNEVKKITRL